MLQLLGRPPQVLHALVGLRREELEREDGPALLEDLVDSHAGRLRRRDDVEVDGQPLLAAELVLDVHRVVLAVGAEQAEEDAGPADPAELALLLEVLRRRTARARRARSRRPRSAARRSRTRGRAARRPWGAGRSSACRASRPADLLAVLADLVGAVGAHLVAALPTGDDVPSAAAHPDRVVAAVAVQRVGPGPPIRVSLPPRPYTLRPARNGVKVSLPFVRFTRELRATISQSGLTWSVLSPSTMSVPAPQANVSAPAPPVKRLGRALPVNASATPVPVTFSTSDWMLSPRVPGPSLGASSSDTETGVVPVYVTRSVPSPPVTPIDGAVAPPRPIVTRSFLSPSSTATRVGTGQVTSPVWTSVHPGPVARLVSCSRKSREPSPESVTSTSLVSPRSAW